MTGMANRTAFDAFFQDYAESFTQLECEDLKRFFHLPATIVDPTGVHLFSTPQDIEAYLTPFLQVLRSNGLTHIDCATAREPEITTDYASGLIRYRCFDGRNRLLLDFDYLYHLLPDAGSWQILLGQAASLRVNNLHA